MICWRCDGTLWVCENHPECPWEGEHACGCGGAGMPCPICNPSDKLTPPKMPPGFVDDDDTSTGRRRVFSPRFAPLIPSGETISLLSRLAAPLHPTCTGPFRGVDRDSQTGLKRTPMKPRSHAAPLWCWKPPLEERLIVGNSNR
jgi:hypothetical protein